MTEVTTRRRFGTPRNILISAIIIPLLALTSTLALLAVTHHPARSQAATLPTPWWHHLSGERELDAVRYGYTLQTVQNNLSTYKAEGYQVINLDWPVVAGPTCIYGGFSGNDYYHADPRLHNAADVEPTPSNPETSDIAAADTDWTNFVTAVHNQGMAVNAWFNPSYIWVGAAFFKQAEADVRTYGTNRANQPANSPARYFAWRSQAGAVTKPAESDCTSSESSRWVTDPDAGSNVSYYGAFSDQPSGDYSSPEWVAYITGALRHWLDTGIDGFVFDWPRLYVNCTATCIKNTLVATVHSYSNRAAFGEAPQATDGTVDAEGFDGIENGYFWGGKPWTDAITTQNPSTIESSGALTIRDDYVSKGLTSYMQFAPKVLNDNAKNLLAAATLMGTGNYLVVQSTQATTDSDGNSFGEFGTWPSDSATQASFLAMTNAMRNNAALDSSGARTKVSTNNDNAYYAFTRTSPDGAAKAVAVLNYTSSQQTITVNVANQGIADGTTTNLVGSGGTPTISGNSFRVTLPAWGYGFYGVTSSACATNLCGKESASATNVNLTSEGSSDWAHWGANNSATAFDRKSDGGSQISNYRLASGGTVNWFANNPNSYTWTNGTPTASATGNPAGIWVSGVNNGFTITAPADTTTRTLRLYVGVWKAQGRLTATLSDNSASTYIDATINNSSGTATGEYTLTYTANGASNLLTVTFAVQSAFDPNGNVTLEAATLQGGGSVAPTPTPVPPTPTPGTGGVTTIDDNASGWTYGGGWTAYSDGGSYLNTAHGGETTGAYGQYTFTGMAVSVYGWKALGAGSIQILIDGTSQGTFSEDNGGADAYNQLLLAKTGLSNGSHTIRLVAATAPWTMVDYLTVTA